MYDFAEGAPATNGADPSASRGSQAPPRALLLLELPRWIGEYSASRALDLLPTHRSVGRGRPVLVIPGFPADDVMTGRLRAHLRRRGFTAHGWGQGRNIGLTDRLIDGLLDRFDELTRRHGEPISVVGWSFGGLLARWLAHTRPDDVRQVVCLGSPWRAEGERTRATAMFERSRAKHGISDRAEPIIEALRGPVPVPLSAIYSRTDGIVGWRGCAVDEAGDPVAENIEVPSSHVGLVASPLALAAVTDRLGQYLDDWQPFAWRRCLTRRPALEDREAIA